MSAPGGIGLLILALSVVRPVAADQTTTGRIVGTVTDAQGSAIVGTTVSVLSPSEKQIWRTRTDGAGRYDVGPLEGGLYELTVDAPGFSNRYEN